jgi:hypothetical protein
MTVIIYASFGIGHWDIYITRHKTLGHLHQGVCKDCALGKNAKAAFPSSDSRSKALLKKL